MSSLQILVFVVAPFPAFIWCSSDQPSVVKDAVNIRRWKCEAAVCSSTEASNSYTIITRTPITGWSGCLECACFLLFLCYMCLLSLHKRFNKLVLTAFTATTQMTPNRTDFQQNLLTTNSSFLNSVSLSVCFHFTRTHNSAWVLFNLILILLQ